MPDTPLPTHTLTLNDLLTKRAVDLSRETDLPLIVAGLREQSDRWNANQASGSRKLVKSKNIPLGTSDKPKKPTKPKTIVQELTGLKL